MKRIVLFSTLFVALLLTGCSNNTKKLVCTQNLTGVDVKMIMDYDSKDNLTYVGFEEILDLSVYSDEEIETLKSQDYCPSVKESVGELGDAFKNCTQDISNKKLTLKGEFSIDKLPSNHDIRSYEKAVEILEEEGYKCEK